MDTVGEAPAIDSSQPQGEEATPQQQQPATPSQEPQQPVETQQEPPSENGNAVSSSTTDVEVNGHGAAPDEAETAPKASPAVPMDTLPQTDLSSSNPPSPTLNGDLGQTVPSYQFISLPITPAARSNRNYVLKLRQQPKHSRMCGFGEKVDRRPVDPPPIIQMEISAVNSPEDAAYLFNPYFFMYASLISPDSEEELHLLRDGKTRSTTGSIVSSLYRLKDLDGRDGAFFVFPDLSVRMEGSYRLKFSLFEIVNTDIFFCTSVLSDVFHVYPAKKFPGMEESTLLSRTFAEQGLKIRIRKELRLKNESKSKRNAEDSSPDRRKRSRNRGADESDDGTESDDESNVVSRDSKMKDNKSTTQATASASKSGPANHPQTQPQVPPQQMPPPGYPAYYGRYYPPHPGGPEMNVPPPPQGYAPYGGPPKSWGPHDPYAPHPYMQPGQYEMHGAPGPYHPSDPSQHPPQAGGYHPHMPPPSHYPPTSGPGHPPSVRPPGMPDPNGKPHPGSLNASSSSAAGSSNHVARSPTVAPNAAGMAPPMPSGAQWGYRPEYGAPQGYPPMYPPYPMNAHGHPMPGAPPSSTPNTSHSQSTASPTVQSASIGDRRDMNLPGGPLPPINANQAPRRSLPPISNASYPGNPSLPSPVYPGGPGADMSMKKTNSGAQQMSNPPPPSPSDPRGPSAGYHHQFAAQQQQQVQQQQRPGPETSSAGTPQQAQAPSSHRFPNGSDPARPPPMPQVSGPYGTMYPPQHAPHPYGDPSAMYAASAGRPPVNHPQNAPSQHPPSQHMQGYPPHMYYPYPPAGAYMHPGSPPPPEMMNGHYRPGMVPPYGAPRPPYPYDPSGQPQQK